MIHPSDILLLPRVNADDEWEVVGTMELIGTCNISSKDEKIAMYMAARAVVARTTMTGCRNCAEEVLNAFKGIIAVGTLMIEVIT